MQKAVYGFFLRDILDHGCFASVEGHAARSGPHVTIVGVGHLAGTVDYATHDGDLEALHSLGGLLHAAQGALQVKEGAAAAGAGDVLGTGEAQARGLENRQGNVGELLPVD